jgi:hypothetical protein
MNNPGYVYQIDPSNGTQLHSLPVTSAVGVGDYTTRLACDGRSLFTGVHGDIYKFFLLAAEESSQADERTFP